MSLRRRIASWLLDDRLRWLLVVILAVVVAVLVAADAWGTR